jgi:hypothetical protein
MEVNKNEGRISIFLIEISTDERNRKERMNDIIP